MEVWNWDENDTGTEYNDAAWSCSSGTGELSKFQPHLLSPTDIAAPIWPQSYETSSKAIQRPLISADESTNCSDNAHQNAEGWEYWDAWGDIRYTGCDGLTDTSKTQHTPFDSTSGISPLAANFLSPISYTSEPGTSESTSAGAGRANSTSTIPGSPTLRGAPADQWLRGTAESSKSLSSVTSSYVESSNKPSQVNSREDQFKATQELSTIKQLVDHELNSPTQTGHISCRTISTPSSQAQSSPQTTGKTTYWTTQPPGREKRQRSHGKSEKNYRMKLDEQFLNLLQAVPQEMVERAGHFRDRLTGEKLTSKATTLDLAVDHVQNLEAEERELMGEAAILGGQVAAYRRLISGRGGHWQKWAES